VTDSAIPLQATERTPMRPIKQYRKRWPDRIGDALFRGMAMVGVGPASLLTTTGRRTGQFRSTPVIPVRQGGRLWLVAPYGEVSWLLNARAAGHVVLRRRRDVCTYTIREVPAAEAGPILKQYIAVASATRPYFRADKDAPISEFIAEAELHPVLELTNVELIHEVGIVGARTTSAHSHRVPVNSGQSSIS
jgi:deazaflavin-dependent oxidoreductase (nitroreductase family)